MNSLIEKIQEKEQARSKEFSVLFWKPEPGEIIEGTIEGTGSMVTEYGDAEYLQIVTADEKKFMVFLNLVLHKIVETEDVKTGDRIAIKYAGMVQSRKSKYMFKNYVLVKSDDTNGNETEDVKGEQN